MKKPILFALAVGLGLVVFGGIAIAQPGAGLSKDARTVVKGDNDFAFALYGQLRHRKGNLFFSPYSISSALAMTYAGAKGETAEEMARTLHFTLPQNRLHPAFGELVHLFNAKSKKPPYELSVANALWGQKGLTFQPDFLKVNQDNYEAGLKQLDFVNNTEQARQTINAWVERQTQNRIKELLKPRILDSDTRLVLTNAIYFKAAWEKVFEKSATRDEDFSAGPDTRVKVPMMHKVSALPYAEGDTFQAVAIPYQKHALSMIVLLPKKADGLPELEKTLTEVQLSQLLAKMGHAQVDLKLPRFKVTAEFQLEKALARMGMPLAFTPKANFTGMTTEERLYIDKVIHKAYVDVHEQGTEAAAATAVIMAKGGAFNPQRATFHADHPFVFLIRENRTGSILFLGRVVNPKS